MKDPQPVSSLVQQAHGKSCFKWTKRNEIMIKMPYDNCYNHIQFNKHKHLLAQFKCFI